MSLTDPIANYLTLIRNALQAKHQKVDIPSSRLLSEMTQILKDEGYITNFKTIDEGSKTFLRIYLRYGPPKASASFRDYSVFPDRVAACMLQSARFPQFWETWESAFLPPPRAF